MAGTDLVIRSTDVPANFREQMDMARVLADSSLLPGHLRGKPANVLVILQGARALDVSGFWALQSMHVVDGKLGMAAELMRALVIRAGHQFSVVERSAERAVVEIKRRDKDKPYRAVFTRADAEAAKLLKKDNWVGYLKSMLVARATSIAVRDECPDVMFGVVYTPDELGAVTDADGTPQSDADGNIILDGEVVPDLTDEDLLVWAETLGNDPLENLAEVWTAITQAHAADRTVPDSNETLRAYITARLMVEAAIVPSKVAARDLWALARTLDVNSDELKARLTEAARGLPEVAPDPVPVREATVITSARVPEDHARSLRDAALASWTDPVEASTDAGTEPAADGPDGADASDGRDPS